MKKLVLALLAPAGLILAMPQPADAQEAPLEPAEYVNVTAISIDDGHMLEYANHLADQWRKSQDFAVEQGWITSYEILGNMYKRRDEPDLYLVTRFTQFADHDEEMARQKAYNAHMQMTMDEMEAASAGRAEYRTIDSDMLLRRYVWSD